VLVWPVARAFANRAEASPAWALDELCARAQGPAEGHGPSSAQAAAATLEPFWAAAVRDDAAPGQLFAKALPAALAVADAETAALLLRPFAVEHLSPRHLESLVGLAESYGERWAGELLATWFGSRSARVSLAASGPSREQWLTSLPALCGAAQAHGSAGADSGAGPGAGPGPATVRRLLELSWEWLAAAISSSLRSQWAAQRGQQLDSLATPLAALVTATSITQAADLRAGVVDFCRQHGDELAQCVVAALRAAPEEPGGTRFDGAFAPLADDLAARLRTRLAQPARAADDWSIQLPDGCSCELCGTLGSFLADPARRTLEWPLAAERRAHVESRVNQAGLPVSQQTRRQGRPHTLVLTKTAELFEREARRRDQDQDDLDWLLDEWPSTR
jgi:hypothetical protein